MNYLILKLAGLEHFPLKLNGDAAKKLINAAFSSFHYYEMSDLTEL